MKKSFLLAILAVVLLSVTSCENNNTTIKHDIENYYDGKVDNISIKEIDISEKYWFYTNDFKLYYDRQSDLMYHNDTIEKVSDEISELETFIDHARDKWFAGMYDYKQYYRIEDSIKEIIKPLKYKQDSLYDFFREKYDDYAEKNLEKCNEGTIYVAKLKHINKFGKKYDTYSYEVFTYNNDGSLYKYTGDDLFDIIITVYPKAVKESAKQIQDELGM